MRVSDEILKCVGFISPDETPARYGGTAFVVGIPVNETEGMLHLVTAKHVAVAVGESFAIGINGKDGMPIWMKNGGVRWFYHPTEADCVDVAVLPFASAQTASYDVRHIPVDMFATEERITRFEIGLGDEVVNVGLFAPFAGKSHFIPIVRTGNIGMMPKDRVPSQQFGDIEVYLVEGRSLGGLSGSPVFCRSTVNLSGVGILGQPGRLSGLGQMHLLGLMHGHWDIPTSFEPGSRDQINMGVAIVIPAKKILEVLYSPELVELREEAVREGRQYPAE